MNSAEADRHALLAAGTAAGHIAWNAARNRPGAPSPTGAMCPIGPCGYPIGECRADGTHRHDQPDGSGGLCSSARSPSSCSTRSAIRRPYIVPDVVVDFSSVTLEQIGPDRVLVRNVKGYAPTATI